MIMLVAGHPGVPVEDVADGGEGVAAVAAGGGEVGADAAVALQGRRVRQQPLILAASL